MYGTSTERFSAHCGVAEYGLPLGSKLLAPNRDAVVGRAELDSVKCHQCEYPFRHGKRFRRSAAQHGQRQFFDRKSLAEK